MVRKHWPSWNLLWNPILFFTVSNGWLMMFIGSKNIVSIKFVIGDYYLNYYLGWKGDAANINIIIMYLMLFQHCQEIFILGIYF